MAKTESAPKEVSAESEKKVSPMVAVPQSQPQGKVIEPLVPFDRWFASKGFKDRWKPGMAAYTDISVRRSMSDWNEIFKNY